MSTSGLVTVGLPLATLVLGYAGSVYTESRRDKRAETRVQRDREAATAEVRRQRLDAFEFDVLSRAQSQLSALEGAAVQIHILHSLAGHRSGTYGTGRPDEALDLAIISAMRDIGGTIGLLGDHEIREALRKLNTEVRKILTAEVPLDEGRENFGRWYDEVAAAQDALGSRVRAIYEG